MNNYELFNFLPWKVKLFSYFNLIFPYLFILLSIVISAIAIVNISKKDNETISKVGRKVFFYSMIAINIISFAYLVYIIIIFYGNNLHNFINWHFNKFNAHSNNELYKAMVNNFTPFLGIGSFTGFSAKSIFLEYIRLTFNGFSRVNMILPFNAQLFSPFVNSILASIPLFATIVFLILAVTRTLVIKKKDNK